MLCDYSKFVALYKLGEVYFRLLGTNSFSSKGREWKILLLQARVVVITSNMEIPRGCLAYYVKKLH